MPVRVGPVHQHLVQVYYEDTDHSGVVYHANYLKFFERAREHIFGPRALRELFEQEGLGFVVVKADLAFKAGARFGDTLRIETRIRLESPYRAIFDQTAVHAEDGRVMVEGEIQLACVDRTPRLVRLPSSVTERIAAA